MDLDANQDIDFTEWHQYIVGYLCKQLEQDKLDQMNAYFPASSLLGYASRTLSIAAEFS